MDRQKIETDIKSRLEAKERNNVLYQSLASDEHTEQETSTVSDKVKLERKIYESKKKFLLSEKERLVLEAKDILKEQPEEVSLAIEKLLNFYFDETVLMMINPTLDTLASQILSNDLENTSN